jgi:hypothetical protein
MTDKDTPPARLITGATRPDLYELLRNARAANDDAREQFQAAYRRKHWFLASLAWFAESGWRIAGLIVAAYIGGAILEAILP